jgi:hypothetical protein
MTRCGGGGVDGYQLCKMDFGSFLKFTKPWPGRSSANRQRKGKEVISASRIPSSHLVNSFCLPYHSFIFTYPDIVQITSENESSR